MRGDRDSSLCLDPLVLCDLMRGHRLCQMPGEAVLKGAVTSGPWPLGRPEACSCCVPAKLSILKGSWSLSCSGCREAEALKLSAGYVGRALRRCQAALVLPSNRVNDAQCNFALRAAVPLSLRSQTPPTGGLLARAPGAGLVNFNWGRDSPGRAEKRMKCHHGCHCG